MTAKSSPVVHTLFTRTPIAPLTIERVWRPELSAQINALDVGINVKAALHLLNDDFDGCHNLAQTQEGNPYSDNLHAIAHRREPDYWNSQYWYGRLYHNHMSEIYFPGGSKQKVQQAAIKFVDDVKRANENDYAVQEMERKQWEEMTKLTRILMEMDGPEGRR
ncbi:hypothetical protein BJ138DRAFT_1182820 [Hygrophoropsis aurantiaca]|uniref:Uncharacterized protein n=1 Tax=Hygrophoropsis aurantiaca TaxID=72124 RepID=A0ACB8A2C4_9AGAM|nr:hypothetical protein BJ138DRAFT_1182820 [Hygrophoropsis aurantiaca]